MDQASQDRLDAIKAKAGLGLILEHDEVAFLRARRDYLTDDEKEKLLPKEEEVKEKTQKNSVSKSRKR